MLFETTCIGSLVKSNVEKADGRWAFDEPPVS
jgi:hypothetical protein